jgi:hypothetical protein
VPGKGITGITLTVKGHIHGLSDAEFQKLANGSQGGLSGFTGAQAVEIRLKACGPRPLASFFSGAFGKSIIPASAGRALLAQPAPRVLTCLPPST